MTESKNPTPEMPPQPPSPDDTNRDVVDFENFGFQMVNWVMRNNIRDARMNVPIGGRLRINNELFPYKAVQWSDHDGTHREFEIISGEHQVKASLSVKELPEKNDVYGYIGRNDTELQEYVFQRDIGMKLYSKLLEYLQFLANSTNRVHHHYLVESTNEDIRRWHKHFDSIISEFGYQQTAHDTWEKTYVPQK